MFKTAKLPKRYLNLTLEDLLKKYDLVKDKQAFPQKLYISSQDYKQLRKNIKKKFKKESPYMSKRSLEYSVGLYMLDLAPNESLGDAIKPGFVLIEQDKIKTPLGKVMYK